MGQTITVKILAAHCGKKFVVSGVFIELKVDLINPILHFPPKSQLLFDYLRM